MIPTALQERAEALGLTITTVKGRSALFAVWLEPNPSASPAVFMDSQMGVRRWLEGAKWASEVFRIDLTLKTYRDDP